MVRKTCWEWTRKLPGKTLKRMSSASGRSDGIGPERPATTRAEPGGAAGGESAATRGSDGGGPRCDGMAAVGSGGHAQAVSQFSMPVSCRGQLLAGGQTGPPVSVATVSETGTGRGRLETVSGWDLSRRAAESADPGAATTAAEWTPPEWQQCAIHCGSQRDQNFVSRKCLDGAVGPREAVTVNGVGPCGRRRAGHAEKPE